MLTISLLKDIQRQISTTVLSIVACLTLNACTISPVVPTNYHDTAYLVEDNKGIFSRYAPVIIPEKQGRSYNKIGAPVARLDKHGKVTVSVDTSSPTFYVQQRNFSTEKDSYTNLIYRIHFEKVPFSLIPFYLTTGKNVGLLIVVTLNSRQQPVLITTVHTCGCYVAITPTSYLPSDDYPDNWDYHEQKVYGMTLPGQLHYPQIFTSDIRPVIFLQHATHRVMHIDVAELNRVANNFKIIKSNIDTIVSLKNIPINGQTTSLYETEGHRKGYVKNSFKPLELLLISWWSLDWHVGVDKEYGDSNETGTVFYTSLKPWQRSASDMWNFGSFLDYWGWNL